MFESWEVICRLKSYRLITKCPLFTEYIDYYVPENLETHRKLFIEAYFILKTTKWCINKETNLGFNIITSIDIELLKEKEYGPIRDLRALKESGHIK